MRQYSFGDYFWSVVGFIGLSIPNFLLALVLMFYSAKYFGGAIGGLFSKEFQDAAWSIPKVVNMMQNLAIPVIVIGTASTAGLIRILRANLLDELKRPYVELARAKGLTERRLIVKYPLRIAINPFLSGAGSILPGLISGAVITEIVLDLPAMGPGLPARDPRGGHAVGLKLHADPRDPHRHRHAALGPVACGGRPADSL